MWVWEGDEKTDHEEEKVQYVVLGKRADVEERVKLDEDDGEDEIVWLMGEDDLITEFALYGLV